MTVVDRVLDAASSTFGVRLALPNPELALPRWYSLQGALRHESVR